jgi:hypothetical protein
VSDRHALVPAAIDVLASAPAVLRAMIAPLPDELLSAAGAEGWCARDVVAHLAARQRAAIIDRVTSILEHPGAPIPEVPQRLMDVTPYRAHPLFELLEEFEEGRKDAVALLRGLSDEQLKLRGVHAGIGEISIADLIHHLAFHDLLHVAQAAQLAGEPLEALRGAMRAFR